MKTALISVAVVAVLMCVVLGSIELARWLMRHQRYEKKVKHQ